MKGLSVVLLALLCLANVNRTLAQREVININREWKYTHGSPAGQPFMPGYDDAAWQYIHLPHSFSLPYFREKEFYIGYGWYRKVIDIPASWKDRRTCLDFEGVFQHAHLYVNGQSVGTHNGGYTGFTFDISAWLKAGKNLIAVQVDNLWNPRLAPRAGEHVFSGGIYRDVYLRVTDALSIRRNGVSVTTPDLSDLSGKVKVSIDLANGSHHAMNPIVRSVVKDKQGNIIAVMQTAVAMPAGKTLSLEQCSPPIPHPQLWTPETPTLYQVETTIEAGGRIRDNYRVAFGFRWLRWTADSGLFVNGKHYVLRGANVHQDHAGWGDAVTHAGICRDLQLMKEAGFNFIRGSHYPHHPYFAQVCDELGLFFLPENCFWGIGGSSGDNSHWQASAYPPLKEDQQPFEQSVQTSLVELIQTNRNHPSIIAWSMGNESFFSDSAVLPSVRKLLKSLVATSRHQDPTRAALMGGAQRGDIDNLGDVAGYNGDGAILFQHPGFPSLVTEYGSCVADRPGSYIPCWGDIKDGSTPAWRTGQTIWCGFDHGSIAGEMGKMGVVDYFRIPKRSWYWYRNAYRQIPPPQWPSSGTATALTLSVDKTILYGTDGTDDAQVTVRVRDAQGNALSNSPPVTLTILSGPGEFPTGRSITFHAAEKDDIRIQDGIAAIEFRSYEGGLTRIEASSAGLRPDTLLLETMGYPRFTEGATRLAALRSFNPDTVFWSHAMPKPILISAARPARASSMAADSKPSMTNDGNTNTAWRSASDDKAAWWELDMENFYRLTEVKVHFPAAQNYRATVELSTDGSTWVKVGELESEEASNNWSSIPLHLDTGNRFLRLVFGAGKPAAINEIMVFAQP